MIPDFIKHWFLSRTGRVIWVELNNPSAWVITSSFGDLTITHKKSEFRFADSCPLWHWWSHRGFNCGFLESIFLQSRINRLVDIMQADKVVNL